MYWIHCSAAFSLTSLVSSRRSPSTMAPVTLNRTVFEALDRDGDKKLGTADLDELLNSTGHSTTPAVLAALVGRGSEGGLTMNDLEQIVNGVSHQEGEERKIGALLSNLCPQNGTGVDLAGLLAGFQKLGLVVSDAEAQEMMREFDRDQDGRLTRDELVSILAPVA